jgi:hypothetical protein
VVKWLSKIDHLILLISFYQSAISYFMSYLIICIISFSYQYDRRWFYSEVYLLHIIVRFLWLRKDWFYMTEMKISLWS